MKPEIGKYYLLTYGLPLEPIFNRIIRVVDIVDSKVWISYAENQNKTLTYEYLNNFSAIYVEVDYEIIRVLYET